ncbi:MAG TPA: aminotransferase class V-fold PLP-dependent enzyme [Pyrinomonadaceae bacterium]|jgi:selenocysteine lyase/cysteine desulfurase|nr:aminotransferase class V-fold PLP-dependent enzyme [Pyrinomonadaceae bacterium]
MSDGFDWQGVRRDFPVTDAVAYLNSAATGAIPRQVAAAASGFYGDVLAAGDAPWNDWMGRRERARALVARLVNAEPEEIGFTTNTSAGMNLIVDALEGRGEVVSSELEFPVTTLPWMHRGVPVRLLKARGGEIKTEDLDAAAQERAGVICLSHVQFSNGFRAPLAEIGAAKGHSKFVVNAAQSAGVFQIDVKRMQIDALCSTGHKWLLAGYGSGFVYLSRELLEETRARAVSWMSVHHPFAMRNDALDLRHDAAARAETGCPHFAGVFALEAAVGYHLRVGGERVERRALELNRRLTDRLIESGWKVLSPLRDESARSAETLVACDDPARVVRHLHARRVAVTQKPEGIRVATHFFNDESDIERLINALDEVKGS